MSRAARVHFSFRPIRVSQSKSFLVLLGMMCFSAQTLARESIDLLSDQPEQDVVAEVLVRAEAELEAVGFLVRRCTIGAVEGSCVDGEATGRLEISDSGGRLVLRAWARGDVPPLTQELDLSDQGISAEVAAIRAVELLRATLSLSLREGNLEPEEGGSLEAFTGADRSEPAPEPEEPPATPEPATPEPERGPAPEPDGKQLTWSVGLGPSVSVPKLGTNPSWGGEFFVDAAVQSIYVGAAFDAALVPTRLEGAEGRTDITAITAALRAGWVAPCRAEWVCRVGLHGGVIQYDLRANESGVFSGSDARHVSFALGADVTVAWYFQGWMGVFARVRAAALTDAPRLELDEPLTLGRPTGGVSVGVTFR